MKYCISYAQSEKIKKLADEIRYPITQLDRAIVYATENVEKKIIVEIDNLARHELSMDKIYEVMNIENLFIDFYQLHDLVSYVRVKGMSEKRKYMYHYPINTWGLAQILIFYKVSDVTIGEPLTFQIDKVINNIKSKGINIRVCPCIARQDLARDVGNGIEHFFLLPQFMESYEQCIDVLDLTDKNTIREEFLFLIYAQEKEYKLDLNALILNAGTNKPAYMFDKDFFTRRINCGQTCMEGRCHFCDSYLNFLDVVKMKEKIQNGGTFK